MTTTEIFEKLDENQSNADEMLGQIVAHFRETEQPMELFEALKMRIRARLGISVISSDEESNHSEEIERQLESGLLEACRESGKMLIKQGRAFEGWTYLRPTGDTELARELLADIEINDDNYDEMIQVLLHEGVDVARGYQTILDQQGTCNSITIYDQAIQQRGKPDQRAAARCLLNHFYDELSDLVRSDITDRDKSPGDDETLHDMISTRKWVLDEGGYHLDTTHLSAVVRIASVLSEPEHIQKAWELTQYGRRLHHQFQYPGDEPFVDFYPAYSAFYGVLKGENVDAGLKIFERKAKSVDSHEHGTGAIETYVDLLDRVGRHDEAIKATVELVPDDVPSGRIVPLLVEIAGRAKDAGNASAFDDVVNYCKDHNDVIGCAAALHAKNQ